MIAGSIVSDKRPDRPVLRILRIISVMLLTMVGLAGGPVFAAPERVVSVNLCADELVLLLAAPNQVVSVTHLSQMEQEFPFWRTAQRYSVNDGSIAAVAGLRPDLIVSMGGLARDRARLADRIGAEIVTLPYPQSLDDLVAAIAQVASALGREARGQQFVRAIRALEQSPPPGRSDVLFLSDGGLTIAPGTLAAEWLALAGVAVPEGRSGRVSAEDMLIDPPLIVVRSDYRAGQTSRGQFWPGFRLLAQSPNIRHLRTDGRRWTCAGPSLLPEIVRLREALAR